jgi:hypothetical protein
VSKIKVSTIETPAADWRKFMPLAHAEVAKFLKTQEVGKFEKDELLSKATIALATAKPSDKWARKAIKGALFDHVRTCNKIVNDHEKDEVEYLATTAKLDDILETARAAKLEPCDTPSDNPVVNEWRKRHRVTVGPAPRRVRRRLRHPITGDRYELPSRIATSTGYKVNSKHNKVAVAPVRCAYQDGWEPTLGGMKRARIEDDEDRDHTPSHSVPPQRGELNQASYSSKGRKQRFSSETVNHHQEHRNGLTPAGWCDGITIIRRGGRTLEGERSGLGPAESILPDGAYYRDDGAIMVPLAGERTADPETGEVRPPNCFVTEKYHAATWMFVREDESHADGEPCFGGTWVLGEIWRQRNRDAEYRPRETAWLLIEEFGSHYTENAHLIAAEPAPWSHTTPRYAEDASPKLNPTEALPDNRPPRTKAWWTAVEEEGSQCKSALWQRGAGDFQISWGRLVIHEGNSDEYVVKGRQVDGGARWLCERDERIFLPESNFRDYWGDIYNRGTLSIAPPLGSGSPGLAAPLFIALKGSEAQPTRSDDRPVPKLCQIAERSRVQGPIRPPALPDPRWRPARTVIASRPWS